MSDPNVTTAEELTKLKLGDLRKLCKKHDLSTAGTKLELISRLIENQGENFTILQPGDEAKLLGDDVDDDTPTFTLPEKVALQSLDKPEEDEDDLIKVSTGSELIPSAVGGPIAGSKRAISVSAPETCPVPAKSMSVEVTEIQSETDSPSTVVSLSTNTRSETERLSARAARFGLQRPAGAGTALTDDKLAARARRFGLPINENRSTSESSARSSPTMSADPDVLRKRAERFGEVTSPVVDKLTEQERKANRLTRFGFTSVEQAQTGDDAQPSGSISDEARKAARAIKFGSITADDKLSQRKARFGIA